MSTNAVISCQMGNEKQLHALTKQQKMSTTVIIEYHRYSQTLANKIVKHWKLGGAISVYIFLIKSFSKSFSKQQIIWFTYVNVKNTCILFNLMGIW